MKIIELRIGNIVGFKNRDDCYCVVTDLSSAGGIHLIRKFYDGDEDDQPEVIDDITPILLTEKLLLKLGFEYSETRKEESNGFEEWHKDGCFLGDFNNECFIMEALDQGGISVKIEYVHQLQNLYFVLTGNELQINENKD